MDEANIPPAMGSDALPPVIPAPPPEVERNKIFYGPDGLRAGWRLLIFALILGSIVGVLSLIGHYAAILNGPPPANPSQDATLTPGIIALGEIPLFGLILFVSWIMGRIERRQISHYGLPSRPPFPKNFWAGL